MYRYRVLALLIAINSIACVKGDDRVEGQLSVANEFIDAFYSFDPAQLESILELATESKQGIMYYQGWAEGGNYEVKNRAACQVRNDSLIVCPVTVKDDLIGALQIDMFVTDTFHITIRDMKIMHIATSSNDPSLFHEARKWVRENRPELVEAPCDKATNAPGDCVRAMVQGYREFIAVRPRH